MDMDEKELAVDQLMKIMQENGFASQTLEELREEALKQPCGTMYSTLILGENDRLFLVACFASAQAVRRVCEEYGLPDTCSCRSWGSGLVYNALYDAIQTDNGLCFTGLGNEAGELTAVAVIAAKQAPIAALEKFLNIAS